MHTFFSNLALLCLTAIVASFVVIGVARAAMYILQHTNGFLPVFLFLLIVGVISAFFALFTGDN